jgi:hypothetical protein
MQNKQDRLLTFFFRLDAGPRVINEGNQPALPNPVHVKLAAKTATTKQAVFVPTQSGRLRRRSWLVHSGRAEHPCRSGAANYFILQTPWVTT